MSRFSARFYTIEKQEPMGPSLKDSLFGLFAVNPARKREVQIAQDYVVRLERLEEENGEISGEFVRVHETDFPFEVSDDEVLPLNTEGKIGLGVAFRYRPRDHTLIMQYDARVLSPSRAMSYLEQQNASNKFVASVKLDSGSWKKFEDSMVKSFSVKIAQPKNLKDIEDAGASVGSAIRSLGEAYDAQVIEIKFGMGHYKGKLSETVKTLASVFRGKPDTEIQSLRAKIKDGNSPAEDLDLLDEIFSHATEILYPKNDPAAHYEKRRKQLKDWLNVH